MKIIGIILFWMLGTGLSSAQVNNDSLTSYLRYVNVAESHFKQKEYGKCAIFYSLAFVTMGGQGKVTDRYRAASCWALSNNVDSAFAQLNRIADKGKYMNLDECLNDPAFIVLHSDKRWQPLISVIERNVKEALLNSKQ